MERLLIALLMVQNKAIELHIDGKDDKAPSLVPFADLFKYRSTSSVEWGYKEEGERSGVFIRATGSIAEGEPIYFSYGDKPNSVLLATQGFIDPENKNKDLFELYVKLKRKDPLAEVKKEKLRGTKALFSLTEDFSS